MSKRLFTTGSVACVLLLVVSSPAGTVWTAEPAEELTEEAQVWEAEEKVLAKAALEKDGFNPLERSYAGVVHLAKVGFSEDEKAKVKTINVGHFVVKGRTFVLRVEDAELLSVLRKVPDRKPVSLLGTVRMNGKYFVARDVSLAIPGQGSVAPPTRRRRGGI